jgi:peptidoglycan/xylan/chitin deacetylase (PgdA/CDA1 family)
MRGVRTIAVIGCLGGLAGCDRERGDEAAFFTWTTNQTYVGSFDIDNLDAATLQPVLDEFSIAVAESSVVMVYGHNPGGETSWDTIHTVLQTAQELGLDSFTYADLAAGGPPRSGICLSFDDTEVDDWYAMRPLLAAYDARASFFVTRYYEFTDAQKAELQQLYADGDGIEAHTVHHLDGPAFIEQNGMDAWLTEEVQPSIDALRADGYTPVALAYPGGAHTAAMNAALVPVIPISRGISEQPR